MWIGGPEPSGPQPTVYANGGPKLNSYCLTDANRRDLLEILDDCYGARSTLITSQLPIPAWHDYLADPTLADAILDRFIHNAHHLDLRGDSMRKTKSTLTRKDPINEG